MFLLSISDNEVTDVTSLSEGVTRKTVKKNFHPTGKIYMAVPPFPKQGKSEGFVRYN